VGGGGRLLRFPTRPSIGIGLMSSGRGERVERKGEDRSGKTNLGEGGIGGVPGRGIGGVEAKRRESELSEGTRPSNTQPLRGGVDQPRPGTGEARSRSPDLLAVIPDCNLGLGFERGWSGTLPQDDNDGRDISRRYGIDPETTSSRLQSASCGPVNMERVQRGT